EVQDVQIVQVVQNVYEKKTRGIRVRILERGFETPRFANGLNGLNVLNYLNDYSYLNLRFQYLQSIQAIDEVKLTVVRAENIIALDRRLSLTRHWNVITDFLRGAGV